jgi:signal transduction histidine kinase
MNLTRRFSLTHGFIALLSVAIVLAVMIGGARFLFLNEARDSQRRQVDAFALAARESYFAHEDVAVLNFIRMAVKDEIVVFAAYTGEKGKTRLVMPSSFQGQNLTAGAKVLPNGSEVEMLSLTRLVLPDSSQGQELAMGLKTLPDGRKVEISSLPVEASGKIVGAVYMAYDPAKVEERVRAQVGKWVGLGMAGGASAMGVALLVSVLLARQLAAPLRRIRAGTQEVRSGKLDKLVDVKRSDEIGDLARDFNDMVLKLKELETMKRDFISGVTHDFGTPLHAIKTALELLQEGKAGPLTDRQAEYLLMVSNSTIQLTSFVNNLLTTAKIEAAKSEPYY